MLESARKPLDALTILNAIPGCHLILLPDAPVFTIAGATDDYLKAVDCKREELIGRGVFETITGDPGNPQSTGVKNLGASLHYVLEQGKEDRMAHQRNDIYNPAAGQFEQRVRSLLNKPVFGPDGSLQYIIHTVEDITEKVRFREEFRIAGQRLDESEKRFRNMVEQAPIAILLSRGEDIIIESVNESMLRFMNKARTEEVLGKKMAEALPELKGQAVLQNVIHVQKTGKRWSKDEVPVDLSVNGKLERHYFNLSFTPVLEEGAVTGVLLVAMDVTEQVKARLKAEEKRAELQLAIEIADLGTFHVDLVADQAVYSQRVRDWFGFSDQGLSMQEIPDFVHPEDREKVIHALRDSCQSPGQSRHDVTYRVLHPLDGKLRHLRSIGNTLFSPDGRPYLMIGLIQDITPQALHQRQLEENDVLLQQRVDERTAALEKQKALIGSILDASLDGIYALKAVRDGEGAVIDFTYLFANNQVARMLEAETDRIIGSSMLELIPENRNNGFFDLFCRLLGTGETYRDETHFVAGNMDNWFDFVIIPIDGDTLVVSVEDITEKKEAVGQIEEQRVLLDNILRNSSNGISVSKVFRDENGRVVDAQTILANDAAVHYIGFPREIYLTKRATEIEPGVIGSPYYQMCLKTLETGEAFITQYFVKATGRWLELTVSRLDEDHLIQVFSDVTPIKETQLQLERYVEDLKRSNQNLEEFAYAASHDLKEPMRKIQLFSGRLRDRLQEKMDPDDKNYFDRIMHATGRMNALIDDLLMYSHVSRGAVTDEQVDLNIKVRMVLEDLDLEIEEKGAKVRVDALPTVRGHRRQLQQLFQNLIGNAIKYHKPGERPEVQIGCRTVGSKDEAIPLKLEGDRFWYLIEVRDNGIGFEQADAERIFNVFTRLHGHAEYKGTGVGLSIARKVAENHGGFIWAESSPGAGASFKLLLPAE